MHSTWEPLPGPQTIAAASEADILFYGGAAGGGKTELLLGVAHTKQWRSIIFRREYPQLRSIIDRSYEIFSALGKFNRSNLTWHLEDGRTIEFGAVHRIGDERKYQGRAHDLKAFDELAHFGEMQFRGLCGWLRSEDAKQRCRVLATGNPPANQEGEWIIRFFAPWLDSSHAKPALPGELRWFTTIDGKEVEVPDGSSFIHNHEVITPKSRTFIPARVEDNPYYIASGYKATLQSLPEPMRSQLLYGDFKAGRKDNPYQIIPTEWVERAMRNWEEQERPKVALSCIGVDVARGGSDRTVLTLRYGHWFDVLRVYEGITTTNGNAVAQLVLNARGPAGCKVHIDVIGVGASVFDALRQYIGDDAVAMNAAQASLMTDKSGELSFINKRAQWWWKLRESLDPESGDALALPPDRELLADLVSPLFHLTVRGIQVESKDSIVKRIGRSPDKGDSLVYAHAVAQPPVIGFIDYYKHILEKEK